MPPRYAYWTIIVDNQPTAFRSAAVEELMPTFNRLKAKQPTAVLKWFQNGKLWNSRLDAREAQQKRGEDGRRRDTNRQTKRTFTRSSGKLEWKPKGSVGAESERKPRPKLEWSPKPERTSRPPAEREGRREPAPRDSKWRPGGEHRDPRQKYKDAKKAKWTRFKQAIRRRRGPGKP